MTALTAPAPTRSRSATTVVLTVIAGTVMIPLDVTIVAIALARLSQETGASLPVIQWVSPGYTLALAAVIPSAAWAIARYGARRVFLTAVAVFTVGSLLVATAWDAPSMIAFRVVQGVGGGFVMPAAMTLTLRAAAPSERGRVMALLGGCWTTCRGAGCSWSTCRSGCSRSSSACATSRRRRRTAPPPSTDAACCCSRRRWSCWCSARPRPRGPPSAPP